MWNLGLTIIIKKGLVGKTKFHACYKKSHIILDLIWKFKFERVKCQAGKSSRSAQALA